MPRFCAIINTWNEGSLNTTNKTSSKTIAKIKDLWFFKPSLIIVTLKHLRISTFHNFTFRNYPLARKPCLFDAFPAQSIACICLRGIEIFRVNAEEENAILAHILPRQTIIHTGAVHILRTTSKFINHHIVALVYLEVNHNSFPIQLMHYFQQHISPKLQIRDPYKSKTTKFNVLQNNQILYSQRYLTFLTFMSLIL